MLKVLTLIFFISFYNKSAKAFECDSLYQKNIENIELMVLSGKTVLMLGTFGGVGLSLMGRMPEFNHLNINNKALGLVIAPGVASVTYSKTILEEYKSAYYLIKDARIGYGTTLEKLFSELKWIGKISEETKEAVIEYLNFIEQTHAVCFMNRPLTYTEIRSLVLKNVIYVSDQ